MSSEAVEGAGAAEAPPAVVRARTAAAEKLRRPEARDLVRVMVSCPNGWGRAKVKPSL
ncbi:hypothetical protein ARTHRO9AX_80309 [Arthrobacter sp. 9AX]|nr:hypothetical protein ARTHRO9AX_80309 [Arthrobacter sp. 9AX]